MEIPNDIFICIFQNIPTFYQDFDIISSISKRIRNFLFSTENFWKNENFKWQFGKKTDSKYIDFLSRIGKFVRYFKFFKF